MNYRRITGLFGAAGALAVGTEIAQAQDDLGASIANTVTNAVSTVATNSSNGGTLIGGVTSETSNVDLGEQTGLAIADASGGNNNVSFVS
jgi:2-keto-4-pentenoate hydratase